jgi:hypothetical protein
LPELEIGYQSDCANLFSFDSKSLEKIKNEFNFKELEEANMTHYMAEYQIWVLLNLFLGLPFPRKRIKIYGDP